MFYDSTDDDAPCPTCGGMVNADCRCRVCGCNMHCFCCMDDNAREEHGALYLCPDCYATTLASTTQQSLHPSQMSFNAMEQSSRTAATSSTMAAASSTMAMASSTTAQQNLNNNIPTKRKPIHDRLATKDDKNRWAAKHLI